MSSRLILRLSALFLVGVPSTAAILFAHFHSVSASAGEIDAGTHHSYSVLQPLESGDLTIFPVVAKLSHEASFKWPYITLDEGLRSGEVVVTEAGRVTGLVRPRARNNAPFLPRDQVNSLVLVNNSDRPLILLAGEIVTGGKQDRVIAKDRIVPPGADPIDLSVFCIEPGRWVESSETFGAAGKAGMGFMVQPMVRREAMAEENQQQVWNAVGAAVSSMATAAAPPSGPPQPNGPLVLQPGIAVSPGLAHAHAGAGVLGTTSYAKVMQEDSVGRKVDEASRPLLHAHEELLAKLRQEHAVGVVVAVRGHILWADIFADTDLLAKYWTKLIRSYAAETLTSRGSDTAPVTAAEAQEFVDANNAGHESSEGESGVYRYREIRSAGVTSFVLEALMPGTNFDVHISKMRTETYGHLLPIR